MELEFNWINLLILFGAFHGVVFGVILLFNKRHPGAKFLAAFMFVLSYNGFETFNWSSGLDQYNMVFNLFVFVWIYGLGPSLYLYVRALLAPDKKLLTRQIVVHYSPMIFQFAMRIVIILTYVYSSQQVDDDSTSLLSFLLTFYGSYSEPMSVVVFLFYLGLSIKLFLNSKKQSLHLSKQGKQVVKKWVKALLICMMVLGVLWPLILIIPSFMEVEGDAYYYPIEILLVFFIYWIAFVGYHQIKMIDPNKNNVSPIKTSEAEQHLAALEEAMANERLYLDPELNREKVAAHLGLNAKVISAVLNQHANQNFNDFINSYRINEVTTKLKSGEGNHLTISGIALDAGFNSQATFQRVFKSLKGMSPKEFQRLSLQETEN